jgi:hypothetical protein
MAYNPEIANGTISTNNSSTATLGGGAAFTGTADEITNYSSITIYVISNVASATDGLSIQQSNDGTNWDITDVYTVPAASGKTFGVQCTGRYLRVVYTNGAGAQASFRLQTILHAHMQRNSTVRPQDGRSNENDFSENLAYATAFNGSSWDRVRTVEGFNTASSTPSVGLLSTIAADRRYTSLSLGTVIGNTQSWDTNAADSAMFYVGTSTTGTFLFEVTADGSNWQAAEARLTGNDSWQTSVNQTPTSGNVYRIITAGYRSVRVRTIATLGSTVAFTATLAAHSPTILAIKTGPAPHNIGYTPVHKDVEYTTQQTGAAIWTPASGKKFVVTDITVTTGGTTSGVLTLWQGASGDTTFTVNTDPVIFRGEFAPSANSKPGMVKSYRVPFISTTADHILRITTSAALTCYIQVEGYEI